MLSLDLVDDWLTMHTKVVEQVKSDDTSNIKVSADKREVRLCREKNWLFVWILSFGETGGGWVS